MNKTKHILSCDWGTSFFRLRLVDVSKAEVIHEVLSDKGIASVYNDWLRAGLNENEKVAFYKNVLQQFIQQINYDVNDLPVIVSGMASSTIGMKELEYAEVSFNLKAENLNTFLFKADNNCRHDVLLVSGLKTNDDVMRGEETMLLGCDLNDDKALMIFPGTHSKHVIVKNNIAVDFKTYMTGEFFELLSTKTVLSKSVIKNVVFYDKAFTKGVEDGTANNILNASFHVRTNQLFKKFSQEENYYYLSGLVIGYELKEVIQSNLNIHLICSDNLMKYYLTALKILVPNKPVNHYHADKVLIKAHCKFLSLFIR